MEHVRPEAFASAITVNRGGDAGALAGGAADDDVGPDLADSADIVMDLNSWEMASDLSPPRLVDLTERGRLDAGPLEADRVRANAGEEVETTQRA